MKGKQYTGEALRKVVQEQCLGEWNQFIRVKKPDREPVGIEWIKIHEDLLLSTSTQESDSDAQIRDIALNVVESLSKILNIVKDIPTGGPVTSVQRSLCYWVRAFLPEISTNTLRILSLDMQSRPLCQSESVRVRLVMRVGLCLDKDRGFSCLRREECPACNFFNSGKPASDRLLAVLALLLGDWPQTVRGEIEEGTVADVIEAERRGITSTRRDMIKTFTEQIQKC